MGAGCACFEREEPELTDEQWREKIEAAELRCYLSYGFKEDEIIRKYVDIEIKGTKSQVRAVILNN